MANTLRFKRGLASGIPTALAGEPLFTTDTFDLYIGNGSGNTRFQKYIASGATTQILRGDGSLYTFPLAISSPSNGQVLKYNGTSWVNDSDSGITGSLTTNYLPKATGATTLGNSIIYESGGGVAIGTTTIYNSFDVKSQNTSPTSLTGIAGFYKNTTAGGGLVIRANDTIADISATWFNGASNMSLTFTTVPTSGSYIEAMRITPLQNLHIGTFSSDSGEKLQVTGTAKTGNLEISSASPILKVTRLSGNQPRINFGGSGAVDFYLEANSSTGVLRYDAGPSAAWGGSHAWFTDQTQRMILNASGNLGLGVTPSAWQSDIKAIQISNSGANISASNIAYSGGNNLWLNSNSFQNSAIQDIYTRTATAGQYWINGNKHIWSTAPSGTAGNAITFTQAMTLDASGRLGIGVTSPATNLHISTTSGLSGLQVTNGTYGSTITDGMFVGVDNTQSYVYVYENIPLIFATNNTERARIHNNGNIAIGSTSDSGERLQVTGTAKITGATMFDSSVTAQTFIVKQNALGSASTRWIGSDGGPNGLFLNAPTAGNVYLAINNNNVVNVQSTGATITGNLTVDTNTLFVDATNNRVGIGTASPSGNLDVISSNDVYQNISTSGNNSSSVLSFYNTLGTGDGAAIGYNRAMRFGTITGLNAAGFTERMRLDASGNLGVGVNPSSWLNTFKALQIGLGTVLYNNTNTNGTFLGSNFFFNGTNNIYIGNGTATAYSQSLGQHIWYNAISGTTGGIVSFTQAMTLDASGNLGINIAPSYKLDVSGSARVSDAIAIGTTPDTNNPFKILKNINATVGIKFENTNTSSLAFSAVQLGTDVSGGTKFTNLVYASSGVTASGVYNPDGTSLINNGNGGLNFLGNPIRMYTGGSNGVLRWDISNEGIIQYNATSPTTSATDAYKQYSADVTAGNAAPHFRTENGAVIKLYQETTAVGNSTISVGGGNAVLDDTEFDGYTLRQIVKALRNQGILA